MKIFEVTAKETTPNMDKVLTALKKKLKDEGGAAGFDPLKAVAKTMDVNLTPAMLKGMSGIKMHKDGDYILEGVKPGYATQDNDVTTKYAAIAFLLNDHASKMDSSNDEALQRQLMINQVAASIEQLNTVSGPKSLEDIAKAGKTNVKTVKVLLKFGNDLYDKHGDIRQGNDAPDDADNEFDDGPSDDEIARQADDRASKRRR